MGRAERRQLRIRGDVTVVQSLTDRERQVLRAASRGLSARGIGYELGVTVRTAEFHLLSIYDKLAATNRAEAINVAHQMGILQ